MWQRFIGKLWRAMPVWGRRAVIKATQPSFTVSAATVVTDDAGRILLLNHILRPASGWGVPGGFLNRGEQPDETAKREIFEETGLRVSNLKMYCVKTNNSHVEFWFTGTANGEAQAKSREILEARWFAPSEIPSEMSGKERQLIKQALQVGEKARK